MFELLRLIVIGGFLLMVTFLVLIALPKSKLREALMPFACWGFALLCGCYVLTPVDLAPEIILGPLGLIDDAGAVVAGVAAIRSALRQRRELKAQQAA